MLALLPLLFGSLHAATPDQNPFFIPYPNRFDHVYSVPQYQWDTLNASVEGRLFQGVPFAKPCFTRYQDQDVSIEQKHCQFVKQNYGKESVRTAQPSSQINTQWETCQTRSENCLLNSLDPFDEESTKNNRTCHLGSVSNYYIDVRKEDDIRAAFKFSRATSVPLVIKNTGHDYKGRSSAPSSLGLWTHNLQEMTYHSAFAPACPSSIDINQEVVSAVTLGAGVRWFQAYAFAKEHNVTLVGGADKTVGTTGGWLQGGGHGALSNTMGLGADRVLEFKVITPDGQTRIANHCQNQDLFFALRGGGGGTFGVVLSATSLASPVVTIQAVLVAFPPGLSLGSTSEGRDKVLDRICPSNLSLTCDLWNLLLDQSLRWAREGWGGYVNANSALYLNPVMGPDEARESVRPLMAWGAELKRRLSTEGRSEQVTLVAGQYGSWSDFFDVFADENSANLGQPLAITSRLIPASLLETGTSRQQLLEALIKAQQTAPGVRLIVTTPFNYPNPLESSTASPRSPYTGTSVNPAWRTSVFHVTTVSIWNWNATRGEISENYVKASRAMDHLRRFTEKENDAKGTGELGAAYLNEADVYEKNHEEIFWGQHYPSLLRIKHKYDPDRLLDCWHCVGWNSEAPRFSCYL